MTIAVYSRVIRPPLLCRVRHKWGEWYIDVGPSGRRCFARICHRLGCGQVDFQEVSQL